MITAAQVAKLRAVYAAGPSVLSLYLWVPVDVPAALALPARADELLTAALPDAREAARPYSCDEERKTVRRLLQTHARDWLGHTAAIFAAHEAGLAEAWPLPCRLPDRAVLAARPHVRPLLVALQRCPACRVVVADRQHAWLFRITGDQIDTSATATAPGVRSPGFGGWYGLESHRTGQRIAHLAHQHYHDTAILLRQAMPPHGGEPLIVGGHKDAVPVFLNALTTDVRDRFIGSFVVDPHTMSPSRVRELAAPVLEKWMDCTEQQLAARVLTSRPDELTAVGVNRCLAAVNARSVATLLVPVGGLIPGFACGLCGRLASTPGECPHGPEAWHRVPDLLEEMTTATLDAGGEVAAIRNLPADAAAELRFPVRQPVPA
jgi:peptide chain release factor subunit 1